MDEIFNRPEIQSAVAPFIIGFLLYLFLVKPSVNAWIWSMFGAFLVSAGLINGLTIMPLTGTRKIILIILTAFVIAGSVQYLIANIKIRRLAVAAFSISAFLLVFWKIAMRMEPADMALFIAGSLLLILFLLWAFERLENNDRQLHGAGFSLLLGTGIAATLGASALLGQLALSLSAASGAVFLGWVIKGNTTGASHSSLPYALAAALLGLAAVIFARLPWYSLIPLGSIPLVTSFVPKVTDIRFTNALVSSLPGLFIALAVSFWVWQPSSSGSGY